MQTARFGPLVLLVVLSVLGAGCQLVGDIFQAGMAVGIIVVLLVIAVVVWLIRRLF